MQLNIFRPFSEYLRPYKTTIILGLALLLVVQAAYAAIPLVLKQAIDSTKAALDARLARGEEWVHIVESSERDIAIYAGMIVALALVLMVGSVGMRWYLASVSRRVERDLRRAYFSHLLTLPLAFFQERRVGDLMARAASDVEAIQRFLSNGLRLSLTGILGFFLSLGLMCSIDWQLALYALLPMPVMVFTLRLVAERTRQGYRRVQEQFAEMTAHLQENLAGIRVVKAYVRGAAELQRFAQHNAHYVAENRRLISLMSLFHPFTFLLSSLSLVLVLWLGGRQVLEGTLTLGAFVAFNAYLIRLSRPMMILARVVDEYQRAMASMSRLEAILQEPSQEDSGGDQIAVSGGEIELRNVGFAYASGAALDQVNVRVPAGSTLAVVGRVGSGKTTLARLIPRLIQADQGQVLIDGVALEDLPLATLRGLIGYVPQDTFLFSDTLRENIALGLDDGDGQVEAAAEVAQLSTDLEQFPQGLETVVGERGVTLSGGQKQRAALARAIIRRPQILILDDALASVDTRTEEEILKRLRQVMATRTTILIAHRISTVKDADHILVLDAGRIVEQGTHAQLVERGGVYADMYRRQHLSSSLDNF